MVPTRKLMATDNVIHIEQDGLRNKLKLNWQPGWRWSKLLRY